MDIKENIQRSVIRLFIGEANPDDKSIVRDWLRQSPENKRLYDELKDIWLASGTINNSDNYELENALQYFRNKIHTPKEVNQKRTFIYNALKYAAIFLLVVAIPFSYFIGKKNNHIEDTYSTVTCQLGDKSMIFLPDSSQVWLNSGSKLTFNNNFTKGKREVFLEGEAYFSVTKDTDNPFRVKSGKIDVEVLGTEFNLKAYPDENQIATTLIKGSVKIIGPSNRTVISPGQKLVYNNETDKMALYELSDTAPETEWKEGRLVFRNESLNELELKLERWFDVDIVLADEAVGEKRYTGILERESILEVMSYFSLARSVDYEIDGNRVTFFTKKNN
ncbi:FecR family protein [Tangfeifania diversioriginum]|uniref:FecR family protein n=1 Tax=Tangfeifania diversioriginum TaxID=1168035 RepID=A0A1M6MYP8_9BACT|nr:FecR domain-containing protein [Tangfeifania diversioriginum]SHJ88566.1 FecR family protein [Tangfeifania diversioriginum]